MYLDFYRKERFVRVRPSDLLPSTADQEALRTLSRAGYNPGALAALLTKMVAQEKREVGIYRTHPPTALRLAKVKMQVKDLQPDQMQKVRDQRFKERKI